MLVDMSTYIDPVVIVAQQQTKKEVYSGCLLGSNGSLYQREHISIFHQLEGQSSLFVEAVLEKFQISYEELAEHTQVIKQPTHGILQKILGEYGDFLYVSNKGYVGTDYLILQYRNNNKVKEFRVHFTILNDDYEEFIGNGFLPDDQKV